MGLDPATPAYETNAQPIPPPRRHGLRDCVVRRSREFSLNEKEQKFVRSSLFHNLSRRICKLSALLLINESLSFQMVLSERIIPWICDKKLLKKGTVHLWRYNLLFLTKNFRHIRPEIFHQVHKYNISMPNFSDMLRCDDDVKKLQVLTQGIKIAGDPQLLAFRLYGCWSESLTKVQTSGRLGCSGKKGRSFHRCGRLSHGSALQLLVTVGKLSLNRL